MTELVAPREKFQASLVTSAATFGGPWTCGFADETITAIARTAANRIGFIGSETQTDCKDPGGLTLVQVEHVSCEIHFLIRETQEDSALNIDVALVGPGSLADQTKAKPIY